MSKRNTWTILKRFITNILIMRIMKEFTWGLTSVFDSWVSGLWDMLNDPSISLSEWTEWGWEISESCVLTVVFCDVYPFCLSCHSDELLCTVIPRHEVKGVNEKLSGQCSRPKIRFWRGWEQLSQSRSLFTYEMFAWKQFSLYITS